MEAIFIWKQGTGPGVFSIVIAAAVAIHCTVLQPPSAECIHDRCPVQIKRLQMNLKLDYSNHRIFYTPAGGRTATCEANQLGCPKIVLDHMRVYQRVR